MLAALDYLIDGMPFFEAAPTFLLINLLMYLSAILLGEALGRVRPGARLQGAAPRIGTKEILLSVSALFVNTGVTVAGLWLYRAGILALEWRPSVWALFDVALFLLTMDALMYFLHRLAHWWPFRPVHVLHHRYTRPTAISLFALHPLETAGFGSLWIVLLFLHHFSGYALLAYIALNLYFGLVGHLGVELYPRWWLKSRLTRYITTCTFHDQHHKEQGYNLGFCRG